MGDRTYVNLTIREEHQAEAERIIEAVDGGLPDDPFVPVGRGLVVAGFNDVNYGSLHFLKALVSAGIAFDSEWDASGDYARFTPEGTLRRFKLCEGEVNPPIAELLERIDDPEALRAYILAHHEKTRLLPWYGQVENGRRYLARQLIDAELLQTPSA